jgi:hypothetical protein
MLGKIKSWLNFRFYQWNQLNKISEIISFFENDLKNPKINLGQIQSHLNNQKELINDLAEVEFQVFSQWGDDGIIQYLTSKIEIPNKTFIEFGVENYKESNTRFLLINNNWTGYVIDGSEENVNFIRKDIVSWACELHSECAFITKENINDLIKKVGFDPEIGILSIDIDGNDYWVWDAIDSVNPIIVIAEYNSLFGKNTLWSVPYDPSFVRSEKHSSWIYYGASLGALERLASKKGYSLIGCNSKGNNSYFIRNDKLGIFKRKSVESAFVVSKFREAMVGNHRPSGRDRVKLIEGLDVVNVDDNTVVKINSNVIQY